jgi:hypothetical protein
MAGLAAGTGSAYAAQIAIAMHPGVATALGIARSPRRSTGIGPTITSAQSVVTSLATELAAATRITGASDRATQQRAED